MQVFGSIAVFLILSVIIVPMFVCDWEEGFEHNPMKEFAADLIFEMRIRAGPEAVQNHKILREWARGEKKLDEEEVENMME